MPPEHSPTRPRARPPATPAAEPFDRALRRRRHERALDTFAAADFLHRAMADETVARVEALGRPFQTVLDLGGPLPVWPGAVRAALAPGAGTTLVADEDRLPFADAAFDLVISVGGLATVSDLPGALLQARRLLRPDGLFAAAIVGGLTLGELREDLIIAESTLTSRAAPRIAPMVDPQSAAGLLQRAGFAMPVADSERLTVRYTRFDRLLTDLTAMGARSPLAARSPLRRDVLAETARRFAARADAEGKTAVTVDLVYLAGWAPGATPGVDSDLSQAIGRAI
ncbi:class I SAM-dependent methyltransferase [Polymorphobacter sp.]|uniref:class I SAM-dependent methyltransferase n=1 Tax=Polymorphobacter sp. TaxID=1909290 RepID=UPI003F71F622